ncbi:MAG: DUF736 domain-containing protein [Parvularculaceae bacterium]
MSIIGTFSRSTDGYVGFIRTMTINVKAKIVANDKKGNDKAPDFKILARGAELGAAWRAKGNGEDAKTFLRVELDDPSFTAPIRAALFESDDDRAALVWARQ